MLISFVALIIMQNYLMYLCLLICYLLPQMNVNSMSFPVESPKARPLPDIKCSVNFCERNEGMGDRISKALELVDMRR